MTKIEKYNQSTTVRILNFICIVLILLFSIATFLQYNSLKLNLINPLIPEDLVQTFKKPFLIKIIILLSGLFMIVALTFSKRRLIALVLGILLITYYIFSNHYSGGWNTQIS